jgi:hypothetical protein
MPIAEIIVCSYRKFRVSLAEVELLIKDNINDLENER